MKHFIVPMFITLLCLFWSCRKTSDSVVHENRCRRFTYDSLHLQQAKQMLIGKQWVYSHSIEDTCFVVAQSDSTHHFPRAFVFKACTQDPAMPRVLREGQGSPDLCYCAYASKEVADSTRLDCYWAYGQGGARGLSIFSYGTGYKGDVYIRRIRNDTLVIEYDGQVYKDGSVHDPQDIYVAR